MSAVLTAASTVKEDTPEAPYLTPFAWNRCGLILPRYPGMLVQHRRGALENPIDIGALLQVNNVPTKGKAGDWWLVLPVDVDPADEFASDTDTPERFTGNATNNLIDAAGNRIVEVGALTIRVGKGNPKNAGAGPKDATADSIVIEHKGRAVLTVDSDGNITIDAGSNNINLNANNVNVKVSGTMNVGG
jgi:hypothetical protein